MDPDAAPKIIDVEHLHDGLLITFADGKCAVYSADLLYKVFQDAQQVDLSLEEEQD